MLRHCRGAGRVALDSWLGPAVLICSLSLLSVPSAAGSQTVDDAGEVTPTPVAHPEGLIDELLPFEVVTGLLDHMDGVGLTPDIENLGPKSGLGVSLLVHRFRPLALWTGVSLKGSQLHGFSLESGRASLGGRVYYTFRRDTEDEFWGIGPHSEAGDLRSDFLRDKHEAGVAVWRQLDSRLSISGSASYENNRVGVGHDGDVTDLQTNFDDQDLVGLGERVEMVRMSASGTLSLITRDGFRRSGGWFQLGASHFQGVDGTDADFNRVFAEVRGYLPFSGRHTLAVRSLLEVNRATGSTEIPFFDLARFGGSRNGPRGFTGGRFRDRDGLSIFTEWRIELWRDQAEAHRIQAVLFFDQGGVAHDILTMSGREFRSSYGIGARLMERHAPDLATFLYAARSADGVQIGVKTHWPF